MEACAGARQSGCELRRIDHPLSLVAAHSGPAAVEDGTSMPLLSLLGLSPTAAMRAKADARTAKDAPAKRYDVQVGIVALTQATLVSNAMRALSAELARLRGLLDVEMRPTASVCSAAGSAPQQLEVARLAAR